MKPKFNPGEWLIFKIETSVAFGKVVGGAFYDDKWHYDLDVAKVSTQRIDEDWVTYKHTNGAWRPVTGNESNRVAL